VKSPEPSSGATTRGADDRWIDDPPTTTPYDVVYQGGLVRLRHYGSVDSHHRSGAVLLVYSLLKRPYILDLLPERSMVRSFLDQGFSVYLTDWLPPGAGDAWRGFDAYVNGDLARAVECVRRRENVARISLVGCCFGGLLSVIYAALHPDIVHRLVPFASPFEMRPLLGPDAVESVVRFYGNAPAWMIRAGLNASLPGRFYRASYLARDLGEPELGRSVFSAPSPVECAVRPWMNSDVPVAGRIFCEIMRDAYGDAQLAESRLRVAGVRVALQEITCPVLNVIGAHDQLVPPKSSAALVERVGSRKATNLNFPTGHLGLMISLEAQATLWPQVAEWLRRVDSGPASAAA
jgi:polyhydroxyalkanoate synthase subunit PhaC